MRFRPNLLVAALCLLVLPVSLHAADGPKLAEGYQLTPGLDRTLLLLQGDVLIRLGADGVTEKERFQLGARYTHIAERRDSFVALSDTPRAVVVLDKKTLKPLREKALQYRKLTDLALHPRLPLAYIAVSFDIEAPSYRVITFNEATGDAHEPRGFYGTWVRVHPAGTFLVTGHRDIYERGSKFFVNPGFRVHAVPDYGNIDLLISYALDDQGQPTFMDLKSKAGGNGNGIRMSADGDRVSYLSHVGTPMFSGNLAGFDPLDLQKLPVSYATKNRASTYDLAYHPYLPLCASAGNGTVSFFHREKGTLEERLEQPAKFDKAHRTYFAPDGKHVVVDSEQGGVRALRNVALKLSQEETALVANPPDPGAIDNAAKVKAALQRAQRDIEVKVNPGKAARDKAVDWLRLQNVFGPNHKIVDDMTAKIDKELDAGRNVQLVFGQGLVKSGTRTFLCIWDDTFFAFPLTAAQDQGSNFPRMSAVSHPGNKAGWRLREPRAELHDLKIANADALDGKQKLTGTVQYRRLDSEPANYALKLQYIAGDTRLTSYHHLGQYLIKSEGEIAFSFGAIDKHIGALPVYVELVAFATSVRQGEAAIASNTVGQIVTVKGP